MLYFSDFDSFENNIPISNVLQFENENNLNVYYILINESELSAEEINKFDKKGFNRIHCPYKIDDFKNKYKNILLLGDYVFYNTIRFILLEKMLDEQILKPPFLVADADVIFFLDPTKEINLIVDYSFFIEGNPGLFFLESNQLLKSFCKQINEWEKSDNNKYKLQSSFKHKDLDELQAVTFSSSAFVTPPRHEQDLLRYLHLLKKLPNANPKDIMKIKYFLNENWLGLHQTLKFYRYKTFSLSWDKYKEIKLNNRVVPFVHFQNNFSFCFLAWNYLAAKSKILAFLYSKLNLTLQNKVVGLLVKLKRIQYSRSLAIDYILDDQKRVHLLKYLSTLGK